MGTFATAINCIDGRIQQAVSNYIKTNYNIDFVDMVTEPGPVKILSENENTVLVESIKSRVSISLTRQKTKLIAIVGHYDCLGNPQTKERQMIQIEQSMSKVLEWYSDTTVIGLWVGENQEVEEVGRLKSAS